MIRIKGTVDLGFFFPFPMEQEKFEKLFSCGNNHELTTMIFEETKFICPICGTYLVAIEEKDVPPNKACTRQGRA